MELLSQNIFQYLVETSEKGLFEHQLKKGSSQGCLTSYVVGANKLTNNVLSFGRLRDGDSNQWLVWHWVSFLCKRGETESLQACQRLQACWPLPLGSFYKLLHYCEYKFTIMLQCTPAYACSTRFMHLYVMLYSSRRVYRGIPLYFQKLYIIYSLEKSN